MTAGPHTLARLQAGELDGLRRLDLSCGLTEFPEEIFRLADTLEVLNLSGNALDALPPDLGRLHRLRVLFCSDNRFTHLPLSVGACPRLHTVGFKANQVEEVDPAALPGALRALILTDNRLEAVPAELAGCTQLEKIMLSGNRLRALPAALQACDRLALLRIAANRFEHLPAWLWRLPRLAWLACGGNPLTEPDTADVDACVPDIDWSQLSLHEVLGQGTSGWIHRATWRRGGVLQPVAVKLFKAQGRMTSDGLPRSEMAACLRAGQHPHVIGAQGRLVGHPDGTPGLVMPLMDPALRVLAGPPSLESCTRDVHAGAEPQVLAPRTALRLALGVAGAAAHLHARGILHGDLYAHNILWAGEGEAVVLGDFGAAALMPLESDPAACEGMQRLEVLSFAWLLEELLARCSEEDDGVRQRMTAALQRCSVRNPAARPSMVEVRGWLAG